MMEQAARSAQSLRAKIVTGEFNPEPYPHKILESALDEDFYNCLETAFPRSETVYGNNKVVNNKAYLLGAKETLEHPDVDPVMKSFFENVATSEFFRDLLAAVASHTRKFCPGFEDRLGVRIEEGTLALRDSGEEADFYFDVQIGVNSPVLHRSRVRAIHVDREVKMLNALLYMRHRDDDVGGGNLEMYRWKGARRFDGVSVAEDQAIAVASLTYKPNTMLLFANSLDSLHGVTPRAETKIVRRYINFLLESREPLFDVSAHQANSKLGKFFKKIIRHNSFGMI